MKNKGIFIGLALLSTFALASCKDGQTPYIGENGNWWIGDVDQGVPARGEKGDNGTNGENGVSIVSITKTKTEENVDTYTIKYSDDTTSTFTVVNGIDGEDGDDAEPLTVTNVSIKSSTNNVDTYEIEFSDGYKTTFTVTNGENGKDLTVLSISKESTEGKYDTYKISFSDNSYHTFIVKNGEDGLTPYIGDNGNWWIGDEDTGVMADGERANDKPLDIVSSGLQYKAVTFEGKTGFVVTGWDADDFEMYLYAKYGEEWAEETYEDLLDAGNLVIPNYVGTMPVIGIAENAKLNFKKVTLSNNTAFIGAAAFKDCYKLEEVDFNGSKIYAIPNDCFNGTKITNIELPSTVTHIFANAFKGCKLKEFDFTNIKHIGSYAFDSLYCNYVYLSKNVERVDEGAFASTRVYTEHESKPSAWSSNITSTDKLNSVVSYNCKMNDEYIYSVDSNEVTVYQYVGNEKEIEVPSKIDNYNVTKVGFGFASAPFKANDVWTEKYDETGDISSIVDLKEVRLPEGLQEIEYGAFINVGTMIMIPSSVTRVNASLFWTIDDAEDVMYLFGTSFYANRNYIAFEGSTVDVYDEIDSSHFEGKLENEIALDEGIRISINNDFDRFEHDDSFYYVNNGTSYSLLSYMGFGEKELVIPSTFNNTPVTTLLSSAITDEYDIKAIIITDGITTIRPFAIAHNDKVTKICIPESVSLINAKGIYDNDYAYIYVEAESKPVDWDTNWTDNSNVYYNVGVLKENNMCIYSIKDNSVALLKYNSLTTNIFIPSEIDGYPVTEIRTGFYIGTRGASVYIPNSVTKIQANAFQNPNSREFYIYCEAESKPENWDSYWKGNSINVSFNMPGEFNYKFTKEYAYSIDNGEIRLLASYSKESEIKIPRLIDNMPVTRIRSYCFSFDDIATVYIPSSITTIYSHGFETTSDSKYVTVKCEVESKPSTWNTYAFYNAYFDSENRYFKIEYNQEFDY